MPSDDLVLNVRQISGYSPATNAIASDALLLQRAGLGGAYLSIDPRTLVGTALATGGDMAIGGALTAQSVSAGMGQFSNAAVGLFNAQKASVIELCATYGTLAGVPIATQGDLATLAATSVRQFNGRVGNVSLWIDDIICAGGAPIFSPRFTGSPRACTPPPTSNSSRLATTAFVQGALGQLTLDFAPIDSPNFTGVPTAPTAPASSSDGQLATTAFVQNAVADSTTGVSSFNTRTGAVVLTGADLTAAGGALLASPVFTGVPAGPTAAPGTNTVQLATTAFVMAAVSGVVSGVSSFNARTGAVTLTSTDLSAAGGALVASSVASFNGRTGGVNLIANDISAASGALLASPAFTGLPTSTTPTAGDNSTRIATTAFVASQTGFAPLASPAFTGVPTAPTAALGTNSTQLATTAFVLSEVAASVSGVASFNSRTGIVTLLANDVTAAGGALLASPVFTGTPSAPTAAPGTSTTQLATTAFVAATATGGIKSVRSQVFNASGTYTPSAGMAYCLIEMVGGGGGGAGAPASGTGLVAVSSGGNAGTYSRLLTTAAVIGASMAVTVGAGGTAAAAGANAGHNGGASSVGAICTATGGTGGATQGVATAASVIGSNGLSVVGVGDISVPGGLGGPGIGMGSGFGNVGGNGGQSVLGGAGVGQTGSGSAPTANSGSGGAGAASVAGAAQPGTAGAAGRVWIIEFCTQ
jgi:hypothetical protein